MLFLSCSRLHSVSRFKGKLTYVYSTDRTKSELMPVLSKYILDCCPSLTCKDQKYKPKWKIKLVWLMSTWSWTHPFCKWFKLSCEKKETFDVMVSWNSKVICTAYFDPIPLSKKWVGCIIFIYVLQSDCD